MIGGLVAIGLVAIVLALRALWHGQRAGRLADHAVGWPEPRVVADVHQSQLPAPMPVRGPDAGTTNRWTVVGGVEVHAYAGSRPAFGEPFDARVVVGRPDSPVLVFTAHQARALAEVLPAAAALCDEFDEVHGG